MSEEAFIALIERVIKDEAFRDVFINDRQKALEDYDLSEDERAIFESLDKESLEEFIGGMGDRTTKGFIPGTG